MILHNLWVLDEILILTGMKREARDSGSLRLNLSVAGASIVSRHLDRLHSNEAVMNEPERPSKIARMKKEN